MEKDVLSTSKHKPQGKNRLHFFVCVTTEAFCLMKELVDINGQKLDAVGEVFCNVSN